MEIILSITVGLIVAIGIWMMLDRGLLRVVLGVVVLGNGVNLAVKELNRDGFMVDGKRVQLEVVSVDDKAEQRYGAVGVYELRGGVWELRMRSDRL